MVDTGQLSVCSFSTPVSTMITVADQGTFYLVNITYRKETQGMDSLMEMPRALLSVSHTKDPFLYIYIYLIDKLSCQGISGMHRIFVPIDLSGDIR